jgi:hypothetical protein
MLQPAEYHEASLTKTVAVLPFDGRGGQQITSEVEGVLGSISIDGKNYFTVVDRNAIDKIFKDIPVPLRNQILRKGIIQKKDQNVHGTRGFAMLKEIAPRVIVSSGENTTSIVPRDLAILLSLLN